MSNLYKNHAILKNTKQHILILGGGFAGLKCALELSKLNLKDYDITLVSDNDYFDYHAVLYTYLSSQYSSKVKFDIQSILKKTKVNFIKDNILSGDVSKNEITGEKSCYKYDYLILALGSETNFFGIKGLDKYSFAFKSFKDVVRLKNHIYTTFSEYSKNSSKFELNKKLQDKTFHFVVVGAGPTGVEVSAEIKLLTTRLAKKYNINPSVIAVDLVELADRVLPCLPPKASALAEKRLRSLGVNVFLNRQIIKENVNQVFFTDFSVQCKTVIWTAGVKPSSLLQKINGLPLSAKNRVVVDKFLRAVDCKNVFAAGDVADTCNCGMATTALHNGEFISDCLKYFILKGSTPFYKPVETACAIPIGNYWAVACYKGKVLSGKLGWVVRKYLGGKIKKSLGL